MPKIKSAIKRVEVAERNRVRNRYWKSAVRTVRTKVVDICKGPDKNEAEPALREAYRVIDTAVSKGVLHLNSAARKKASLAEMVLAVNSTKSKK